MRFVIVTGMSGAGKSTALKMLEDMGYFCVDNLPVPLIPKLAELFTVSGSEVQKAALGVDIRSGQSFGELERMLQELDAINMKYEILYLESSDNVLVKRYKETVSYTHLDVYKRQIKRPGDSIPCPGAAAG